MCISYSIASRVYSIFILWELWYPISNLWVYSIACPCIYPKASLWVYLISSLWVYSTISLLVHSIANLRMYPIAKVLLNSIPILFVVWMSYNQPICISFSHLWAYPSLEVISYLLYRPVSITPLTCPVRCIFKIQAYNTNTDCL